MQAGSSARIRSDINVTPLVDVLLIIFMVVTPMLQKGPAVKLPLVDNPPQKPESTSQILVAIQSDEFIYMEKERLSAEQFPAAIMEAYQRNDSGSVVIKADARLTYGPVKKVMLAVKEAGFKDVGLIAEKRDTAARP
jgi:biopolymer transport protein ExbD